MYYQLHRVDRNWLIRIIYCYCNPTQQFIFNSHFLFVGGAASETRWFSLVPSVKLQRTSLFRKGIISCPRTDLCYVGINWKDIFLYAYFCSLLFERLTIKTSTWRWVILLLLYYKVHTYKQKNELKWSILYQQKRLPPCKKPIRAWSLLS